MFDDVDPLTLPLQERALPSFFKALQRNRLEHIDRVTDSAYGVDSALRLAYVNHAWFRFAAENGGVPVIQRDWVLGRMLTEAIATPLRPLFEHGYRGCVESGRPWHCEYECSSPTEYRWYRQTAYAMADVGVLIINSLIHRRPHDEQRRPSKPVSIDRYLGEDGIVTQCCHCRFVRVADGADTWEWASEIIENPPRRLSHGLCELCLEYFYRAGDSRE